MQKYAEDQVVQQRRVGDLPTSINHNFMIKIRYAMGFVMTNKSAAAIS